jgi:hypothetical protein
MWPSFTSLHGIAVPSISTRSLNYKKENSTSHPQSIFVKNYHPTIRSYSFHISEDKWASA